MRFHRAVADLTAELCRRLASETGLRQVALGGGVGVNLGFKFYGVGLFQ